jgi:SH3-like domain-containing protein
MIVLSGVALMSRLHGLYGFLRRFAVFGLLLGLMTGSSPTAAVEATSLGTATKLPVPRFASLKSDRVNLREGPSKDHRTSWVFQRAGLPVEITAEFETWRRIRDSEGTEGWVLHSLLSGRRTALIAPWQKDKPLPLYVKPDDKSDLAAQLMPGVLATVKKCDGTWCRVLGEGFDGYIIQERLWGAYPGEKVE